MTVAPSAVRIKRAGGWQDIAIAGPPGPPGAVSLIGKYDLSVSNLISNIPQTFDHLQLVIRGRGVTNGIQNCIFRLNGNASANYDFNQVYFQGGQANAQGFNALAQTEGKLGWLSGADSVAGYKGVIDALFSGYTLADQKEVISHSYVWNPVAVTAAEMITGTVGSIYRQQQAITSIQVLLSGGAFAAGSYAWLYGIGPNAPVAAPTAGGTTVSVDLSANQSVTNAIFATLSWGTEKIDSDGMWDISQPTRLTCTKDGFYAASGSVDWTANATGRRVLRIVKNGNQSDILASCEQYASGGSGYLNQPIVMAPTALAAGDYIQLIAYQDSGATLTIFPGITHFGMWQTNPKISPAPATQIPLVSVLPANPVDGQEIYYLADATNGIIWHLRYRAGSSSAYKWEFIGGQSLIAVDSAQITPPQGSYSTNTTPQIAIPLLGEYVVEHGADIGNAGSVADATHFRALRLSDNATFGIDGQFNSPAGASASYQASVSKTGKCTISVSATIVQRYMNTNNAGAVSRRWLRVTPVRVG